VHWILGSEKIGDIEIVGIVEPNRDLARRYSKLHGYSMDIVFNTIEEMVEKTHPEAVTAFNTIYDHLQVVEYCAPRKIHVMVEKPLAASLEHARKMDSLARQYDILLLTNYETSWYGSNYEAFRLVIKEKKIGELRRMIFYTGHPGPVEIGCNEEFLEWLTDPVLNGGGALTDFGCYGANLAIWFMNGQTPLTVSCITQQIKPALYPKVEDDATIILTYPTTQILIQASWNWSHNRKEMEVYGTSGYVFCKNGKEMEVLEDEKVGSYKLEAKPLPDGFHDPFAFMAEVIKNSHPLERFGVSSLENNLIVMQILEIAKEAASQKKTILWDEYFQD
jgi:predicted dehydrogenase